MKMPLLSLTQPNPVKADGSTPSGWGIISELPKEWDCRHKAVKGSYNMMLSGGTSESPPTASHLDVMGALRP